jgi:predicted dehydrogenase
MADEPVIGGLGVAVVGCGYWGMNYLRILSELIEVETVAACDTRLVRLNQVSETFGGVTVFEDLEDCLASDRIHAVIVATPAAGHYAVAKHALKAGKHVLVEKPLTTIGADAIELIEIAGRSGLTLAVGHTFLHNPAVHAMRDYVVNGSMGEMHYLYSRRTNLGPIRHDVSALWDLAPHDVSIFNYLLGATPVSVSAVGSRPLRNGGSDIGFVSLIYEPDLVAHIHVSWLDPFKVREVVMVGSERRVVFDDMNGAEPIRVFEKGVTALADDVDVYAENSYVIRDGDILSPRIRSREPLKAQVVDFFTALALGTSPASDGRAGLAVVEVMTAIDQSIAAGGAPVAVAPMPWLERVNAVDPLTSATP